MKGKLGLEDKIYCKLDRREERMKPLAPDPHITCLLTKEVLLSELLP